MLPDRVSNPGPLTYESGALPVALHSPAAPFGGNYHIMKQNFSIYRTVMVIDFGVSSFRNFTVSTFWELQNNDCFKAEC